MRPQDVNILIACEESQRECEAFRKLGFMAFSCDIQPCAAHHPEWHIHDDVTPYLMGKTTFQTQDGKAHRLKRWHLIVAHPPCTFLCKVSASAHKRGDVWQDDYYVRLIKGREFFFTCLNAKADFVAVENPLPLREAFLPRPSFYTCPSWFGHKYTKKTLWWASKLPPVMPRLVNPNAKNFTYYSRGKYRSRTFEGVAQACAETWGFYILDQLEKRPPKEG